MRALILRRVGLLSPAGGPIIVGPPGNGDVLRLAFFRAATPSSPAASIRNPDAESKSPDRAVSRRCEPVSDRALPDRRTARKSDANGPSHAHRPGVAGPIQPFANGRCYRRPARRASAKRLYAAVPRVFPSRCSIARAFGRPAVAFGPHRELSRFSRPAITGMALMGRAYNQAQKFGAG